MSTISIRLSEEESRLLQEYVSVHDLTLSSFVRELIMDKIEEDLELDEERILLARCRVKKERKYSSEEAWKELGL